MSQDGKNFVLRRNEYVVAARKIEKALAGEHGGIAEITRRIQYLASEPLTVTVLGEFSAGKSSFINRLLGKSALPVAILPKTATLTRLVHAKARAGEACDGDWVEIVRNGQEAAEVELVSHSAFVELQQAAKLHDVNVANDLSKIREIRVFLDDPLLSRLQLLDTPGFNHDQAMDDRTLAVLDSTDIVLWITDALQPAKQTEFEKLRLLKECGKRIWLIVNKADVNISTQAQWEEAQESLISYFKDIGFLDFFESGAIELVSCRERGEFWAERFEQMKERLGRKIFDRDVVWSTQLIEDEWQRLSSSIIAESSRYEGLERNRQALGLLSDIDSLVGESSPVVEPELEKLISVLDKEIAAHTVKIRECAEEGLESITSFTMEFSRKGIHDAFQDVRAEYQLRLSSWRVQRLKNFIDVLSDMASVCGPDLAKLRHDSNAVLAYFREVLRYMERVPGCEGTRALPALQRAVDLLDHMEIQINSERLPFLIELCRENVLRGKDVGMGAAREAYRGAQLTLAMESDFLDDQERFLRDPAIQSLLRQLEDALSVKGQRLAEARKIWSDYETTA